VFEKIILDIRYNVFRAENRE